MFSILTRLFRRRPTSPIRNPPRARTRLGAESLEAREMPAATASLAGGVLAVVGTDAGEAITVRQAAGRLTVAGIDASFPVSQVTRVEVRGLGGDDVIDVRRVTVPVTLDGGGGADRFRVDLTSRVTLPGFTPADRVEYSAPGKVSKYQVGPDGSLYTLTADHWLAVGGARAYSQVEDVAVGPDGTLYRLGTTGEFQARPPGGTWQTLSSNAVRTAVAPGGTAYVLAADGSMYRDGHLFGPSARAFELAPDAAGTPYVLSLAGDLLAGPDLDRVAGNVRSFGFGADGTLYLLTRDGNLSAGAGNPPVLGGVVGFAIAPGGDRVPYAQTQAGDLVNVATGAHLNGSSPVRSFGFGADGTPYWLAADGGLYDGRTRRKAFDHVVNFATAPDAAGTVCALTDGGVLDNVTTRRVWAEGVRSFGFGPDGTPYMLSRDGGLFRRTPRNRIADRVASFTFAPDRAGTLYVLTDDGRLITPATGGTVASGVRSFGFGPAGGLYWLGTDGGLYRSGSGPSNSPVLVRARITAFTFAPDATRSLYALTDAGDLVTPTDGATVATGVTSFALDPDGTPYWLTAAGTLCRPGSDGGIDQFRTGVRSFAFSPNGDLYDLTYAGGLYAGAGNLVAASVRSFAFSPGGGAYALTFDGRLYRVDPTNPARPFDVTITSFAFAPDAAGTLYALSDAGDLLRDGSDSPVASGVRSFGFGPDRSLYWLTTDGSLRRLADQPPADTGGMTPFHVVNPDLVWSGVRSFAFAPDAARTLYALTADGQLVTPTGDGPPVASGVRSFGFDPDGGLYWLTTAGSLRRPHVDSSDPGGTSGSSGPGTIGTDHLVAEDEIASGVRSFAFAPDATGTLYVLTDNGTLLNTTTNDPVARNVRSFTLGPDGGLYWLGTDGSLYRPGAPAPSGDPGTMTPFLVSGPDRLAAGVTTFAFAPDAGRTLYALTDGGDLVTPADGATVRTGVRSFTFGPDGALYALTKDGTLYAGASELPVAEGVRSFAFGPDGAPYWLTAGGSLRRPHVNPPNTTDPGGTSRPVPLNLSHPVTEDTVRSGVQTFAFGPDGTLYALTTDGTLYNQTTGQFLADYVRSFTLSPDGRGTLYVLGIDGTFSDLTGGTRVADPARSFGFGPDGLPYVLALDGKLYHGTGTGPVMEGVRSIGFGPDGTVYALTDDQVLKDVAADKPIRLGVRSFTIGPDGELCALTLDQDLFVGSGDTPLLGGVEGFAFAPDAAHTLYALTTDHRLVEARTRHPVADDVASFSFSPDGALSVLNRDTGALTVGGTQVRIGVASYEFGPDAAHTLYALTTDRDLDRGTDPTPLVRDVASFQIGQDGAVFALTTSGNLVNALSGDPVLPGVAVKSCAFGPDGVLYARTGDGGFYNTATGRRLLDGVTLYGFDPVAGIPYAITPDGLCDATTGQLVVPGAVTFTFAPDAARTLYALAPDPLTGGNNLVMAAVDVTRRQDVRSFYFTPGGTMYVLYRDGDLLDVDTGETVLHDIASVVVHPDGKYYALGKGGTLYVDGRETRSGVAQLFQAGTGDPVAVDSAGDVWEYGPSDQPVRIGSDATQVVVNEAGHVVYRTRSGDVNETLNPLDPTAVRVGTDVVQIAVNGAGHVVMLTRGQDVYEMMRPADPAARVLLHEVVSQMVVNSAGHVVLAGPFTPLDVPLLGGHNSLFEYTQPGNPQSAAWIRSGVMLIGLNEAGHVIVLDSQHNLSELTRPADPTITIPAQLPGVVPIGSNVRAFALNGAGHVVALDTDNNLWEYTRPADGNARVQLGYGIQTFAVNAAGHVVAQTVGSASTFGSFLLEFTRAGDRSSSVQIGSGVLDFAINSSGHTVVHLSTRGEVWEYIQPGSGSEIARWLIDSGVNRFQPDGRGGYFVQVGDTLYRELEGGIQVGKTPIDSDVKDFLMDRTGALYVLDNDGKVWRGHRGNGNPVHEDIAGIYLDAWGSVAVTPDRSFWEKAGDFLENLVEDVGAVVLFTQGAGIGQLLGLGQIGVLAGEAGAVAVGEATFGDAYAYHLIEGMGTGVGVAASVLTAGALGAPSSALMAAIDGAISGAAGSLAGQAYSMAVFGNSFSWMSLAEGTLGGAVGGFLSYGSPTTMAADGGPMDNFDPSFDGPPLADNGDLPWDPRGRQYPVYPDQDPSKFNENVIGPGSGNRPIAPTPTPTRFPQPSQPIFRDFNLYPKPGFQSFFGSGIYIG